MHYDNTSLLERRFWAEILQEIWQEMQLHDMAEIV
jgi:hypothetical protein